MINTTILSTIFISPIFTWCFLLPLIHMLSLLSNILCIIVFCSNVFIKKPIAIYFICLLISDSITLFIGYAEMIGRDLPMLDKTSWFCVFNTKIIDRITDFIYAFMERFCLEWMLYKILWTRVSTILLAILSVQRTRTFFSLSYHETRLCAFLACIFSILVALIITCIEWTGVDFRKSDDLDIYFDIFQVIRQKNSSREFYSTSLSRYYNESMNIYPCLIEPFDVQSLSNLTNQSDCLSTDIKSQFYNLTISLLANHDSQIHDTASKLLLHITSADINLSNNSRLINHMRIANSSDFILKFFYTRSCQITFSYSLWLKTFDFFNSVQLHVTRRSIAIFFGNALPSFIVVVANLLSIKVIYFSKSLKYLKQVKRKNNHRKRRLQNDLRAFLVIIVESFSIILISWSIPIFLTMYHCHTLYIINISACPKINDYLVLFLSVDLFNSATNCLLYSLSGKLFRRKLICVIKTILVCGRGTLWNVKQRSLPLHNHPLDRQLSNNPSTNTNNNNNNNNNSHHHHFGMQSSRRSSYRQSECLSSPTVTYQNKKFNSSTITTVTHNRTNGQHRNMSDDGSYSIGRTSDDQHGGKNSSSEIESDTQRKSRQDEPRKSSQSIGLFLLDKVRSLGSTSSASSKATSVYRRSSRLTVDKPKIKSKKNLLHSIISKRQTTTDVSFSSSSITGSVSHGSQRKHSVTNRYSLSKVLITNTEDNPSITKDNIHETLTSL